jgi:phospholipase/carboxylesterase
MNALADLTGPEVPPAAGTAPRDLIILLHGYGADGQDLIGLAPHLGQVFPQAHFIAPNAPEPCEIAPMGRQWFGLMDRSDAAMWQGVQTAAPMLDRFIDQQLERHGLSADRLALVGFSQGTMMALHVAPRRRAAPACMVGFSGRLVGASHLADQMVSRPPVLLVHGEADEVVPVAALDEASSALTGAGFEVETLRRPGLPHGIDGEGLAAAAHFLKRFLG